VLSILPVSVAILGWFTFAGNVAVAKDGTYNKAMAETVPKFIIPPFIDRLSEKNREMIGEEIGLTRLPILLFIMRWLGTKMHCSLEEMIHAFKVRREQAFVP